jgi:CheY-like chemotaxis protein
MFNTLLVDDNDLFRKSLRTVLSRRFPFMMIEEAPTGAAALQQARKQQLVFMDIRLPDANGLELTRRLKLAYPSALICVLTQYELPEYREAALRSGANEFILKDSLTEAVIVDLVESMLAARDKVLVVGDDEELRFFERTLFNDCWPEVVAAEVAWDELIVATTGLSPDLVLLGPRPGREGLDQLRAIYWGNLSPSMVIVSGADQPEQEEWARQRGIRHIVLEDERLFDELVNAAVAQLHLLQTSCMRRAWTRGLSSQKLQ